MPECKVRHAYYVSHIGLAASNFALENASAMAWRSIFRQPQTRRRVRRPGRASQRVDLGSASPLKGVWRNSQVLL